MTPTVLAIGGSDSSAGAGIQADLKSVAANGGYAATAITVVTAQDSLGVHLVQELPAATVAAQLEAAFSGMRIDAVKSGVLGPLRTIETIAESLGRHPGTPYVLDPVLASTSGTAFENAEAIEAIMRLLFPLATLITPNAKEASVLVGFDVSDIDSAIRSGRALLSSGCRAVLIKGGHLADATGTDVLVTSKGHDVLPGEWIPGAEARGTGCSLASAIATHLARSEPLLTAVRSAKAYVARALAHPLQLGQGGPGSLDHFSGWTAPQPFGETTHIEVKA
ncbi:MAG TPA: bifunctional hydroxymethylpyrimidine kinase/phosphomethylpyrimidine kinase [Tepidiformaceae bacterium]